MNPNPRLPTPPQTLVVEGWRGINHSFALVNQFQLLELARRPAVTLRHMDAPFHLSHWSRATNGPGFHDADEAVLSSLTNGLPADAPAWVYRIFSPLDLRPSTFGGRLAVFAVTELGLDADSLLPGSDIARFEGDGHWIITPSHWSRDRIIDFGFQPASVRVVPHAASRTYFHPLPAGQMRSQRATLGFREDEVLLLNIGAAIWNKGIDVLLKGFALARQQRKDLRLVFKDQRNTYGITGDNFVQSTLANAGLLNDDVVNAITLIPANLSMGQMNIMYGMADCYVSPYRAEGFNLPAYEAMACGTPVIVTAGGATDDFVRGAAHRKIRSTLHQNTTVQGREVGAYREPDLDHLVELLTQTRHKQPAAEDTTPPSAPPLGDWQQPVDQLLALMH